MHASELTTTGLPLSDEKTFLGQKAIQMPHLLQTFSLIEILKVFSDTLSPLILFQMLF
jgi:hypothetical protein